MKRVKDFLLETFWPKSEDCKDIICISLYSSAVVSCIGGSSLAIRIAYIALILIAIFLCVKNKSQRVVYTYIFAAIVEIISLADGNGIAIIPIGLLMVLIINLFYRR